MRIGRITVSDRASAGIYADLGGPEIERVLKELLPGPLEFIASVVPDERSRIEPVLIEFADRRHCALIATTGGTGPAIRDVTPEATRAVIEKELPGFGEIMRMNAWPTIKTAILSRGIAGIRGRCLIVNLPGKPKAIAECLGWLAPAIIEAVQMLKGVDPHGHAG
jgi:molybdopterin adenylyltransferase